MSDKLLVVILSGPEEQARARQGILFALNTRRSEMMAAVELLFFGPGVCLFDRNHPWFKDAEELIQDCCKEGVPVYACVANAKHYRVSATAKRLGVTLLGAQVLIPARMQEGYGVLTF